MSSWKVITTMICSLNPNKFAIEEIVHLIEKRSPSDFRFSQQHNRKYLIQKLLLEELEYL